MYMNKWTYYVVLLALFVSIVSAWGPRVIQYAPAFVQRAAAPHTGTCNKCNRPWRYVHSHVTQYIPDTLLTSVEVRKTLVHVTFNGGIFVLCQKCWEELETPEKRMPYYKQTWAEWFKTTPTDLVPWEVIQNAVHSEATRKT